jgi:hypothetical protein
VRYGRGVTLAGIVACAVFFIERRELGHLLRHIGL